MEQGNALDTGFGNVYDDELRAAAYAELGYPGTYQLAFRDLPTIFARHVSGKRALDFGCGTGRSTRFLRDLGYNMTGVDIAVPMLEKARSFDPDGDYRSVTAGNLDSLSGQSFDLVLSAFTFDNIPTLNQKSRTLRLLKDLLNEGGRIVSVVSSPEIYVNEWASFSTKDFPQNKEAGSGDLVLIVMLDVQDRRPVEDVLCTREDYMRLFADAGVGLLEKHEPLATGSEPTEWKSETTIPPWIVYVLGRNFEGSSSNA